MTSSTDKTIDQPASLASSRPLQTAPVRNGCHPQVDCTQPLIYTNIHAIIYISLGITQHSVRFDKNKLRRGGTRMIEVQQQVPVKLAAEDIA